MSSKDILIVEPFSGGSHGQWLTDLKEHSRHNVQSLELSDRHWKWRMHGGAVTLAEEFLKMNFEPDLIVFSDMIDVTTFVSLARSKGTCPLALYFHENQLTYPWSPNDREKTRKQHYEFINYVSALSVDACFFNSSYHLQSFTEALRPFLRQFPEPRNLHTIDTIKEKCSVLPVGVTLPAMSDQEQTTSSTPRILWNHRWEYDKDPEEFFAVLRRLKSEGMDFRLVVLGESFETTPDCFTKAESEFAPEIDHFGFCERKEDYWLWLSRSAVLPVTSKQEFFGISVVEAIHAGVYPLLPDRLSFPELIPADLQQKHLYDGSKESLYQRLKILLKKPEKTSNELKSHVKDFAWPTLIKKYDQTFTELSGSI